MYMIWPQLVFLGYKTIVVTEEPEITVHISLQSVIRLLVQKMKLDHHHLQMNNRPVRQGLRVDTGATLLRCSIA